MLENYLLIVLALLIVFNFVYSYIISKIFKKVKKGAYVKISEEEKNKLINEAKKEFEIYKQNLEKDYQLMLRENQYKTRCIEQELRAAEQHRNDVLNNEKKLIKIELDNFRQFEENKIQLSLAAQTQAIKESHDKFLAESYNKEKERLDNILIEIQENQSVLEDYRSRRAAVNEAIIREKELQEKQNFYKINISDSDMEDLQLLKELEIKFHNRDILHKAAYDCYVKKPLLEMVKRVLCGRTISGIYKITYIKTGEAYIGKSTDVGKRWTEHAKSVFDIGTIAHALVHTRMKRDGIWNFTWELLEEVEKSKLNEREKYWIEFYETKNIGMNEKGGG